MWNLISIHQSPSDILVVWGAVESGGTSADDAIESDTEASESKAGALIGVVSIASDTMVFHGWQTFSFPNNTKLLKTSSEDKSDDDVHLVNILKLPPSTLSSRSDLQPNLLIIWSNGIYQLASATSFCSIARTYSIGLTESSSYFWALPLSSSLIVESRWDDEKGKSVYILSGILQKYKTQF